MEDNYNENTSLDSEVDMTNATIPQVEQSEVPNGTTTPNRMRRSRQFMFPRFQMSMNQTGHIVDLLRAAMPYIDSRRQNTMDTLMKATDLIQSTQNHRSSGQLSAASLDSRPADMEGLLNSIRAVSSIQERDVVDKMLNYMKAMKLYQTYMMFNQNKDMSKTTNTWNQNNRGYNANSNMMEAFRSVLSPEQASTLDQMSTIMNAMNVANVMSNNNANQNNHFNMNTNHYSNKNTGMDMQQPIVEQPTNQYSTIPNYTYQMSSGQNTQKNNVIDYDTMNKFAPKQENIPPFNFDSSTMNQLYQNVQSIYNMLNQAGLTNNNQNQSNQNYMDHSTATPSGNDNFYPYNQSTQYDSTQKINTNEMSQKGTTPSNIKSMPIPNARQFQSSNRTRSHTSFNQNLQEETLEAASIEPK